MNLGRGHLFMWAALAMFFAGRSEAVSTNSLSSTEAIPSWYTGGGSPLSFEKVITMSVGDTTLSVSATTLSASERFLTIKEPGFKFDIAASAFVKDNDVSTSTLFWSYIVQGVANPVRGFVSDKPLFHAFGEGGILQYVYQQDPFTMIREMPGFVLSVAPSVAVNTTGVPTPFTIDFRNGLQITTLFTLQSKWAGAWDFAGVDGRADELRVMTLMHTGCSAAAQGLPVAGGGVAHGASVGGAPSGGGAAGPTAPEFFLLGAVETVVRKAGAVASEWHHDGRAVCIFADVSFVHPVVTQSPTGRRGVVSGAGGVENASHIGMAKEGGDGGRDVDAVWGEADGTVVGDEGVGSNRRCRGGKRRRRAAHATQSGTSGTPKEPLLAVDAHFVDGGTTYFAYAITGVLAGLGDLRVAVENHASSSQHTTSTTDSSTSSSSSTSQAREPQATGASWDWRVIHTTGASVGYVDLDAAVEILHLSPRSTYSDIDITSPSATSSPSAVVPVYEHAAAEYIAIQVEPGQPITLTVSWEVDIAYVEGKTLGLQWPKIPSAVPESGGGGGRVGAGVVAGGSAHGTGGVVGGGAEAGVTVSKQEVGRISWALAPDGGGGKTKVRVDTVLKLRSLLGGVEGGWWHGGTDYRGDPAELPSTSLYLWDVGGTVVHFGVCAGKGWVSGTDAAGLCMFDQQMQRVWQFSAPDVAVDEVFIAPASHRGGGSGAGVSSKGAGGGGNSGRDLIVYAGATPGKLWLPGVEVPTTPGGFMVVAKSPAPTVAGVTVATLEGAAGTSPGGGAGDGSVMVVKPGRGGSAVEFLIAVVVLGVVVAVVAGGAAVGVFVWRGRARGSSTTWDPL